MHRTYPATLDLTDMYDELMTNLRVRDVITYKAAAAARVTVEES